uniref:Uncharacterized protein n=1 Tax=Opuntia streptacantha TaxID=393608 RepID=A0A7C9ATR2_OPUST
MIKKILYNSKAVKRKRKKGKKWPKSFNTILLLYFDQSPLAGIEEDRANPVEGTTLDEPEKEPKAEGLRRGVPIRLEFSLAAGGLASTGAGNCSSISECMTG